MVTKSRLNVEVSDTETEIIESTKTDKSEERRFGIGNGENRITATILGSDDDQNWDIIESKTVDPHDYAIINAGPSHWWHLKLTGKTNVSGEISKVDGYLTYKVPMDNP